MCLTGSHGSTLLSLGEREEGRGGGFDLLFLVIGVFDGVNGLLFLIFSFKSYNCLMV